MSLLEALFLEPPLAPLTDGRPAHEVWIAARTDGVAGTGTQSDPYDGSTADRFDALMRQMPVRTTIHLGPGTFETRGYGEQLSPQPGWTAKSGQRLLGAGMGLTTLKLVDAAVPNRKYAAIANDGYQDGFEARDFTVDCNVEGQNQAQVVCGAAFFCGGGRHIRLYRVRAIHFGSLARADVYNENFVFFFGANFPDAPHGIPDSSDVVFEECIAEQPCPNAVHNSTIFHLGGGEDVLGGGALALHRGCAIRNCYADGRYVYGPLTPIQSATYAATGNPNEWLVTLTTKGPHGHTSAGNANVSGVAVDGSYQNAYNGLFAIEEAAGNELTYRVRINPGGNGSGGTLGGGVSSHPVSIVAIAHVSGNRYRLKTRGPHLRTTNNRVRLIGVQKPDPADPGRSVASSSFNGLFSVASYGPSVGSTEIDELEFELIGTADVPVNEIRYAAAFVSVGHIALSADNGTGAVVEGNRILHCAAGGPYHDTWPTRDLVCRDNYYHDVVIGPMQALSNYSVSPWYGSIPLAEPLDVLEEEWLCDTLALHPFAQYENSIVVAKTAVPHGLVAPERVNVFVEDGVDKSAFSGLYRILAVPDAHTFLYEGGGVATKRSSGSYRTAEGLRPLASLQKAYDAAKNRWVVTATIDATFTRHALEIGDGVRILKAGPFGQGATSGYNGNVRITQLPETAPEMSFCYELDAEPQGQSGEAGFCAGYFGRIWKFDEWTIENNVIKLAIRRLPETSDYGRSIGVFIMVGDSALQYQGRQLLVARNLVRNVDNRADPLGFNLAFQIIGTEHAMLQGNIVGLPSAADTLLHPALWFRSSNVRTIMNWSSEGHVLRAIHPAEAGLPYEVAPDMADQLRQQLEEIWLLG